LLRGQRRRGRSKNVLESKEKKRKHVNLPFYFLHSVAPSVPKSEFLMMTAV
jgi:hypothetical protein